MIDVSFAGQEVATGLQIAVSDPTFPRLQTLIGAIKRTGKAEIPFFCVFLRLFM